MQETSRGPGTLTRFKDRLRISPVMRPQRAEDGRYHLHITLQPTQVQLHSELPPTNVWTYEGSLPGPTIEATREQSIQVEWVNGIPASEEYPITAVTALDRSQNEPGRSGREENQTVAVLLPWAVVHLHGGRTAAGSDGWTENGSLSGQATLCS